ncbi:MAG: glutathione synthase [Hyphomonadaceae bacterium]|nr:glutathione synthase [Hyphomonadaceae bacterium]
MSLRIAVQMDPIDTLLVERDTSLALMNAAQARGHEVHWFHPSDLWWDTGVLSARAHHVRVSEDPAAHYATLASAVRPVSDFDVVLIRQDPPFDMGYVSNTYLLEFAGPRTLVINHPRGVRDISEKIATLRYPHLLAATFVGRNMEAILAFARRFDQVVLKPSFFAGGEGVSRGAAGDGDFTAKVAAMLTEVGKEPIIVQEFIPAVKDGDKRLFVLDGAPIGVVRRMPKAGEFRANLHVGGVAQEGALDARDREIAAAVAPLLAEKGVVFAGLDVIDGRLTEINVTSPTLVRELMRFSRIDVPRLFWDVVEKRAAARA